MKYLRRGIRLLQVIEGACRHLVEKIDGAQRVKVTPRMELKSMFECTGSVQNDQLAWVS